MRERIWWEIQVLENKTSKTTTRILALKTNTLEIAKSPNWTSASKAWQVLGDKIPQSIQTRPMNKGQKKRV